MSLVDLRRSWLVSDHQIMEKLYIYTTNRRCWFSYKNMSLTGEYHHKSWFLMITWKLLLVTAVILGIEMLGFSGIKAWFRPKEFCGKYLSVGSVSLVGLRGSGSIPGHPGWQFTSRWQSPTPFPIQIRLENGFRIDFPIFLLLLYRCNIDPAYRLSNPPARPDRPPACPSQPS